jgi:hypothetical protein
VTSYTVTIFSNSTASHCPSSETNDLPSKKSLLSGEGPFLSAKVCAEIARALAIPKVEIGDSPLQTFGTIDMPASD